MSNLKTNIVIGPVRFSFLFALKPYRNEEGVEKYTVQGLIDKNDKETIKKIKLAIKAAISKDQEGKNLLGGKTAGLKLPLRDGDESRDSEEYEGHFFITANSNNPPGVVGPDKETIIDPRKIWSGCYGYLDINFYAYSHKGNKGIACGLNNIMKTKDGAPLGGGKQSASTAFKDIEVEEVGNDDSDLDDLLS